jgi:hypothetical protein
MSPTILADSILIHPLLAGRTLLVRGEHGCFSFDIHPDGVLGQPRPVESQALPSNWRGGPA